MKILFGRKSLQSLNGSEKFKAGHVRNDFIKGMRIALAFIFILTFWMGPYNLIKILVPGEAVGIAQDFDMWETSERRHPEKKHYYIGFTLNGEEYHINMDYVDQDWHHLGGVVYDCVGKTVEIRYVGDWPLLSVENMIIDIKADGVPLIDGGHLHDVWIGNALGDTLIGLLAFAAVLLFYLRETGRFRVIWK